MRRRVRRWFFHRAIRFLTSLHCAALRLARRVGRRNPVPQNSEHLRILLTGRFDSDNWIKAHLGPLSQSKVCSRVWMVSTNRVPEMPKVTGIYPPRWLTMIAGKTSSRLLTFVRAGLQMRPDVVGGFHMLVNGMVAVVLGRLMGARTLYFCVGGAAEVLDGGVWGEGNYFAKMETPDALVEKRLLHTASQFHMLITMGTRTAKFFRQKGVETGIHVVSGGIDSARFRPAEGARPIDIILTGRLVKIKRIDVFLQAMRYVVRREGEVTAVIVGDGELHQPLVRMVRELGLGDCVHFAGHRRDVEDWLRASKIFALTSDSESLPLSAMEAMMCGTVPVVSDVGDMGDLVQDTLNGYLVPRGDPRKFAQRVIDLLQDERKLSDFSKAARLSAMRYSRTRAIRKWDEILADAGKRRPQRSCFCEKPVRPVRIRVHPCLH